MLRYVDALHPFVVAVGEDFQTFTADIQHFFALDGAFGVRVEFAGTGESWGSPCLSSENIQAMFRVLKARGVVDFIRIVPAEDVF